VTNEDRVYFDRQIPSTQYEYVDAYFPAADTDIKIPLSRLRLDNPEEIRWLDISPGTVYSGGVDTVAHVYRSSGPSRGAFTSSAIVLRSTVAGYRTRLLLFVER
jgi:hypothetical protein